MRLNLLTLLTGSVVLLLTTQCARTTETENPTYISTESAKRAVEQESATPQDTTGAAVTAPDAKLSVAASAAVPAAPTLNITKAQYRAAIRTADAGLKQNPRNFTLLLTRAKAKSHLGSYEAALVDYNAALRLKSNDADLYFNRGLTRMHLKQYSAAISDYTKALKYKPGDKEAFFGRGSAKMQMFNFKAAITDFTQAIQSDSAYADAYEYRGISYSSLSKPQEARADLEKAAQLNPQASSSLRRYGDK